MTLDLVAPADVADKFRDVLDACMKGAPAKTRGGKGLDLAREGISAAYGALVSAMRTHLEKVGGGASLVDDAAAERKLLPEGERAPG